MSSKDRHNESDPARPSATPGAEASAIGDLTRLGLGDLILLPLAAAALPVRPGDPGNQPAEPQEPLDEAGFSNLSLEELLSLSVSGDDEPDDESEDGVNLAGDEAATEAPDAEDEEEEDAAPDDNPGLFEELQVDSVEWLSNDEDFSLLGSGHGFFDPGVATAGRLASLRQGNSPTALGNLAVPSALPPATPSDPIQTWFSPFAINLIDGTVGENWTVSDAVGTVAAFGAAAQVSYILVDTAGGRFAIDGNTGEVTIQGGVFDFAAAPSHTIIVEADDGSQTIQQTFTIQVSPGDLDSAGLPGDQVINGANGNVDEQLYGGAGNDTIDGRNGDDELYGGSGDDLLIGGNHDDLLFGGSGDDVLHGNNHADTLFGGTGNDQLFGENHADQLFGGGGADLLYGGAGTDSLYGDGGSDYLDGGGGGDWLLGGADDDVLVWDAADLLIDGGDGKDTLLVLAGDLDLSAFGGTLVSLETVDLMTDSGANTLTLSAADVLDMTDNGLLTVLGDAQDTVKVGADWSHAHVDQDGYHLYVQAVGPDLVGLLLGPDLQIDPKDGG